MAAPVLSVVVVSDYAAGEAPARDDLRSTLGALAAQRSGASVEVIVCEDERVARELPPGLLELCPGTRLLSVPATGSRAQERRGAGGSRAGRRDPRRRLPSATRLGGRRPRGVRTRAGDRRGQQTDRLRRSDRGPADLRSPHPRVPRSRPAGSDANTRGRVSIPVFVAGKCLANWGDCLRAIRAYGVRLHELPLALAPAPVLHGIEAAGM